MRTGLPLVPLMDGSLHTLQEALPSAAQLAYIGNTLDAQLLGGQLPGLLVDCGLLDRETADRCSHMAAALVHLLSLAQALSMLAGTAQPAICHCCQHASAGPISGDNSY